MDGVFRQTEANALAGGNGRLFNQLQAHRQSGVVVAPGFGEVAHKGHFIERQGEVVVSRLRLADILRIFWSPADIAVLRARRPVREDINSPRAQRTR